MPCPRCGVTDRRTQLLPGYWRCDAVVEIDALVGAPASRYATAAGGRAKRCGTIYLQTRCDEEGDVTCRCGAPAVGECSECTRLVCASHSDLWCGWRVCDRDLASARMRARAAELAEQRRLQQAEAQRRRQGNTMLQLTAEEAFWLLYVEEPRTEQEIRSAVHALRGLSPEAFTELCLFVLPHVSDPVRIRGGRLKRLSGWPFAGPSYHGRSWFLTRKGQWYRSGSYGTSGSVQGHGGRMVRFHGTEKRAILYEMSWQQSVDSGVA
jgi:hypothetical protein